MNFLRHSSQNFADYPKYLAVYMILYIFAPRKFNIKFKEK